MKNSKEKFDKIKFFIWILVGGTIALLAYDKMQNLTIAVCVSFITIYRSIHSWRMNYDKKYKKEKDEFAEEEGKKAWHQRTHNIPLSRYVYNFLFLSSILALYCLYYFILDLIDGRFSIGLINIIIICILTLISVRYTMNAKEFPLSFRMSSISFVLGIMGVVNFTYIIIHNTVKNGFSEGNYILIIVVIISALMCRPLLKRNSPRISDQK
jgi:hypothetical protein